MIPLNTQPIEGLSKSDFLEVFKIFPTIQGEGPLAGTPAVFVRLAGCTLACPMCFGVNTKSRIPWLRRSKGPKVRLDKIKEGETILTLNENLELVETDICAVVEREVSDWIELGIDGKIYDVTPEHPFFTNRGLVSADSLVIGDQILDCRRKDGKELIQRHNGQAVRQITHKEGRLQVRNVSCSPYNTYLANGMWMHNCDTDYTSRRDIMTPDRAIQIIACHLPRLVVLTGGEPFRQKLSPFTEMLLGRRFQVQIETNGLLYQDLPYGQISVVCSPKGAHINPQLEPHLDALKYVVSTDNVDVDGLPLTTLGNSNPVAKPSKLFKGEIFIQPLDEQDEGRNQSNTRTAIDVCMRFGYRLSIQTHKLLNLE